jgi:hypothetical protein
LKNVCPSKSPDALFQEEKTPPVIPPIMPHFIQYSIIYIENPIYNFAVVRLIA